MQGLCTVAITLIGINKDSFLIYLQFNHRRKPKKEPEYYIGVGLGICLGVVFGVAMQKRNSNTWESPPEKSSCYFHNPYRNKNVATH